MGGHAARRPHAVAMTEARQGAVWFVEFDPTRDASRPVGARRSFSVHQLGTGPSELAIVVPLTTTSRPNPLDGPSDPARQGGVRANSHATPEVVRAVSRERLVERWGSGARHHPRAGASARTATRTLALEARSDAAHARSGAVARPAALTRRPGRNRRVAPRAHAPALLLAV